LLINFRPMTDPGANALKIWTERLGFLLEEEAKLGPDPAQRFALRKQIEEARAKIRELQESGTPPAADGEHDRDRPAPPASRVLRAEPAPGEERVHEKTGMVLVYVPGGESLLGAEDFGGNACQPVHRVVLSPFWIGKYPVTNEQYAKYLAANSMVREPMYWQDQRFKAPQQPVVGVSWEEADLFCEWAGLALPSEAQWEAAARGTDQRKYPWGNKDPSPERANYDQRHGRTTPVGTYPLGAGPLGTLDQAGNVWEWCADVWDPQAYRRRGDQSVDPVSTQGDTALRSLRGGSWLDIAGLLSAAWRFRFSAADRSRHIGFRCVLLSRPEP
jgi:formylglycine-generating enzyme required for sulfatase activity